MYGCEGGRSLLALTADGRSAPCSFWRDDGGGAYPESWIGDATLARFRAHADSPGEPCSDCAFRRSCRGGCRIVAGAMGDGPWAPDPECPRVRRHRRAVAADAQRAWEKR